MTPTSSELMWFHRTVNTLRSETPQVKLGDQDDCKQLEVGRTIGLGIERCESLGAPRRRLSSSEQASDISDAHNRTAMQSKLCSAV
jgi:hypothetical protein